MMRGECVRWDRRAVVCMSEGGTRRAGTYEEGAGGRERDEDALPVEPRL